MSKNIKSAKKHTDTKVDRDLILKKLKEFAAEISAVAEKARQSNLIKK